MEYLMLIGTVTLIHLLAVMSPGPDFLVVMKNSLTFSRKTGIWTSIGVGAGIMIHILYSFIGLSLLISNSTLLFQIIKYAGAAYLFYLGAASFFLKNMDVAYDGKKVQGLDLSRAKSFRIGFLTNVLNPKATLFFLSLFTLVISPETPNTIMIIISIIMVVNTALWFIFLSYLVTIDKILHLFNSYQSWFNKFFGILLVLVALQIVFT